MALHGAIRSGRVPLRPPRCRHPASELVLSVEASLRRELACIFIPVGCAQAPHENCGPRTNEERPILRADPLRAWRHLQAGGTHG
jgi:hypothetical protein